MAGIYLHIPFCASKCHYCNFVSTVSLKHKDNVLKAIISELLKRRDYLQGEKIETIYYGGGTPTILNNDELSLIQQIIKNNYSISDECEITIEANPDDLSEQKLSSLLEMGFNRLSIGTQAFDDKILKQLNRRHSANQSIEAVNMAQKTGFSNINIDLIYGIPGLENDHWKSEIDKAISLNINHISAYHLTVEPGTALEILIKKQKYPKLDEEIGMQQFDMLIEELEKAGYEHYEISNFAKPEQYSKHNTNYWQRKKYLGIGPSAHSYNLESRQWNTNNLIEYFSGIEQNTPIFEKEILNDYEQFNEYIMLSLRTKWGVSLEFIEQNFSEMKEGFISKAQGFIAEEKMKSDGKIITLTKKGKFLADGIASDFFM